MYSTILQIAHDIIIIGGALAMILAVILLLMSLGVAVKVNRVVSKTTQTIEMVSQYILIPFSFLSTFFSRRQEESEEEDAVKRPVKRRK